MNESDINILVVIIGFFIGVGFSALLYYGYNAQKVRKQYMEQLDDKGYRKYNEMLNKL